MLCAGSTNYPRSPTAKGCVFPRCLPIALPNVFWSRVSEIKIRLLSGRIGDATDMLHTHFPTVLDSATDSHYDPTHIFLNLRIQNFIEQSRTIPLSWPSHSLSHNRGIREVDSPERKHIALDEPCSPQSDALGDEERKDRLLSLMLELYKLARALPAQKGRSTYIEELAEVGGLLAYPVPEKSREMRKYLDMSRREAVAEQINNAILCKYHLERFSLVY